MRTLDEVIAELPAATRRKIEVRAQELIAEQLTLQVAWAAATRAAKRNANADDSNI